MNIERYLKNKSWFKIGKWKEPLFLQDAIVRAYLDQKQGGALPYYPTEYFVAAFSQYMDIKQFKLLKEKIRNDLKKNHQHIAKQIKREVHDAIKAINSFRPKQLTPRVIKQYVERVKVHSKQSLRFIIMGYVLEEMYPKLLPVQFTIRGQQFTPQSFLAVTALPKKMMPMISEQISLLKIAEQIKTGRPSQKHIIVHTKKFSWMNSICWWDEPFTETHYTHAAQQLAKKNPTKELKQIGATRKEQYRTAEILLKELKQKYLEAWQYIDMIRDMADMREESWDAVSQAGVRCRPLFSKLAAKHYVSYNQLMMLSVNQMISLVAGKLKVDEHELNRRLISFATFSNQKNRERPLIYSDKKAKTVSQCVENKKIDQKSELSGLIIWPGIKRGRVRVLQSADEIASIKTGEILVCPMTDPDYMPAIKKAKALVTDQGGVLCHAAIVARELKKPCVVGTEIATKFFKSGNLIEVDATHGIVKKLR